VRFFSHQEIPFTLRRPHLFSGRLEGCPLGEARGCGPLQFKLVMWSFARMLPLAEAFTRLQPGRTVHGISAVLLPYTGEGEIDWSAFEQHLLRTRRAGLDVAVNMDTGFGDLLSPRERDAVLDATRRALGAGEPFYAGAYADEDADYRHALAAIEQRGGVPVIIQCRAMHGLAAADKAAFYRRACTGCERALVFELGSMFAAHGEIWDDDTFACIIEIPNLIGAKHSSLDRGIELRRLAARDRLRPDFRVYTGNDLAIDMVAYGSDYLLGLSTFAPESFAARDRAFARADVDFLARNDALQHLGNVGFRVPVPAYKHAAAQFLHIVGALAGDGVHPSALRRPGSERILLFDCACRLGLIDDRDRVYRERVEPFL
jgi:dihydrodipicolinate synthase/N-acetylneuraminate lyase